MCENCDETGHEIARYRRLAFRITNQQVLDGMAQFIKRRLTKPQSVADQRRSRASTSPTGPTPQPDER